MIKFKLERLKLRKKNVAKYYDTYHHLTYFDKNTLAEMLRKQGFEIVAQSNCLRTIPNQSTLNFLFSRVVNNLYPNSTISILARKTQE